MKTILVATDFSQAAASAADYAADFALAINARLFLFHTFEIPVTYLEVPAVESFDALEQAAATEMSRIKDQLCSKTFNKVEIASEVRMGIFFEELKMECEKQKPYAVIMGANGNSGIEHFLYGRHSINAMKNLAWPLITVPIGSKYGGIRKIGLACDMQNVAETVPVEGVKMLLTFFNAELHIINIRKEDTLNPEAVFESGMLENILKKFNPRFHFISSDNTSEAILNCIDEHNIDLLIVLPKPHHLLERIMFKSHSKQLILHSHVPVMTLH